MRVLVDVSAVPHDPVGAGRYTIELVAALSRTGAVDLSLLARRDDHQRWTELVPSAQVHADAPTNRPARLVWEQTRGALPFETHAVVVVNAHLYGAVGGLAAAALSWRPGMAIMRDPQNRQEHG